jgi:hypothetical protein
MEGKDFRESNILEKNVIEELVPRSGTPAPICRSLLYSSRRAHVCHGFKSIIFLDGMN